MTKMGQEKITNVLKQKHKNRETMTRESMYNVEIETKNKKLIKSDEYLRYDNGKVQDTYGQACIDCTQFQLTVKSVKKKANEKPKSNIFSTNLDHLQNQQSTPP